MPAQQVSTILIGRGALPAQGQNKELPLNWFELVISFPVCLYMNLWQGNMQHYPRCYGQIVELGQGKNPLKGILIFLYIALFVAWFANGCYFGGRPTRLCYKSMSRLFVKVSSHDFLYLRIEGADFRSPRMLTPCHIKTFPFYVRTLLTRYWLHWTARGHQWQAF